MSEIITDHALLRYIERVHGVDMKKLKRLILTKDIRAAIKAGANIISLGDCKFIVRNGVIVTTFEPGMQVSRRKLNREYA